MNESELQKSVDSIERAIRNKKKNQSEAHKKALAKYRKNRTVTKSVMFCGDDKALLDYALSQGTFSGYVKRLIREDMERKKTDN